MPLEGVLKLRESPEYILNNIDVLAELSGKPAFQRSTSAETMTAILPDDPPSISQVVQREITEYLIERVPSGPSRWTHWREVPNRAR
jgi:hypothetical protein